jgi:Tol biopolymer transport system component
MRTLVLVAGIATAAFAAAGLAGGFSPDGSKIVFADAYPGQLFVMNADGSGKRPLRGAFSAEPQWR